MKRLLLNHAFKFVESVVFFIGEDNVRSQKAIEKVGAIKVEMATRTYGNLSRRHVGRSRCREDESRHEGDVGNGQDRHRCLGKGRERMKVED
jgi:RimJ/RimL family protein N-acetyltransferase